MYSYKKIDRQLNCWMVDIATKIYVMGSLSLCCVGSISDHVLITVTHTMSKNTNEFQKLKK